MKRIDCVEFPGLTIYQLKDVDVTELMKIDKKVIVRDLVYVFDASIPFVK